MASAGRIGKRRDLLPKAAEPELGDVKDGDVGHGLAVAAEHDREEALVVETKRAVILARADEPFLVGHVVDETEHRTPQRLFENAVDELHARGPRILADLEPAMDLREVLGGMRK